LCGWLPRKDDRWSCTCGHSWNTFETGGVCPACLHQWTNPVPFLYPLVATFRLVCAVTKSRMTEHGGSIQSRARLQEVRGCPMGANIGYLCCVAQRRERMDAHEFREVGHRTVDLLSDYLEHIEERPLFADVEPAKLNNLFAEPLPQNPSSSVEVLQEIQEKLLPYCTHVGHPGY